MIWWSNSDQRPDSNSLRGFRRRLAGRRAAIENGFVLKLRRAGFTLPRSSDEALQLAIRRILEWLAQRPDAEGDLKLPRDASPTKGQPFEAGRRDARRTYSSGYFFSPAKLAGDFEREQRIVAQIALRPAGAAPGTNGRTIPARSAASSAAPV